MSLTETHHGGILAAFYKTLIKLCGRDLGLGIFMTAARTYGARRGRRMALRALRDGNPIDAMSYFAYGELLCSDAGRVDNGLYEATPGAVHERQTDCLWAREFRAMDCKECGVDYCREIDGSIARGFNPSMGFVCTQNMHLNNSCDFYFYSPEVKEDFLSVYGKRLKPGQVVKHKMDYHCADVYQMFCHIVRQTLPDCSEEVISKVRDMLAERYGENFWPSIEAYSGTDFEII